MGEGGAEGGWLREQVAGRGREVKMRKIWVLQGGEREGESDDGDMEYGSKNLDFVPQLVSGQGTLVTSFYYFFFPTVRWGGGFGGVFVIPKINVGQCS